MRMKRFLAGFLCLCMVGTMDMPYVQAAAVAAKSEPAVSYTHLLGKTCDIIFVLLGNGEQCVDCILGYNGILSEMEHGMIVISSTIGVRFMEHIYKSCNEKGIHLIDAPISGGTAKASEGTLTMMLSGEEDAIAVLRPYLQVFCENLYVVGNTPGDRCV